MCEIAILLQVPYRIVSKAIKILKELEQERCQLTRGRNRILKISRNWQLIKKRVSRNSPFSMRNIGRQTGIAEEAVRLIEKEELSLQPYKPKQGQLPTDENKPVRLVKMQEAAEASCNTTLGAEFFSDEKVILDETIA